MAPSSEGKAYIVKNLIPGEFDYQQELQKPLASCPNLRTIEDTVPDLELLIYPFLSESLLQVSQLKLAEGTRRDILRNVLIDIKPNNILVDYEKAAGGEIVIKSVQTSDLEDSVLLPPGKNLMGCLCGNQLWRSPESWARARQNTPSDIFSFGLVSIYVMLNDTALLVSVSELDEHDAWRHVLRRHISFFADEEGFKGLLEHIGADNPFFERLIELAGGFDKENPREPFERRHYVDLDFRDLVVKMTNLNPARRIGAREALDHPVVPLK